MGRWFWHGLFTVLYSTVAAAWLGFLVWLATNATALAGGWQ